MRNRREEYINQKEKKQIIEMKTRTSKSRRIHKSTNDFKQMFTPEERKLLSEYLEKQIAQEKLLAQQRREAFNRAQKKKNEEFEEFEKKEKEYEQRISVIRMRSKYLHDIKQQDMQAQAKEGANLIQDIYYNKNFVQEILDDLIQNYARNNSNNSQASSNNQGNSGSQPNCDTIITQDNNNVYNNKHRHYVYNDNDYNNDENYDDDE